jgi:hypothetical protein
MGSKGEFKCLGVARWIVFIHWRSERFRCRRRNIRVTFIRQRLLLMSRTVVRCKNMVVESAFSAHALFGHF